MGEYTLTRSEKRFIGWHLFVAIAALSIGSFYGPMQAFNYAGWNFYPTLRKWHIAQNYYQGLTLHGVLNAVVWTTFFITGFLTFNVIYGLRRPLKYPKLNALGFWMMVVGVLLASYAILANQASVLYTFYPPMKASWIFYLGLVLLVVGSWIEGYGFYFTLYEWKKQNPGVRTPFIAFASVATMVLWQLATLGVAIEALFMLLPWSLGWLEGIDVQVARTFFWWFGHPLVYFWLLPAYISWYGYLPRQAGGKLFSDTMARLAFWLFILLSVPVGFHHQFVDPGVAPAWKYIHALLTLSVVIPSMMTLFTVVASLEYAGIKRGGKGLLGWLAKLPWDDPVVAAQLLAGLLFIFGGIGGVVNASYNTNLILHNTAWVPGHFHLTVSTAVTLTFMGISYWLVPYLTGRELCCRKVALAQVYLWATGMAIFSQAMHSLGLLGAPRRTPLGEAPYVPPEWSGLLLRVGIGGIFLLTSVYMYVWIMAHTAFFGRKAEKPVEVQVAEPMRDVQLTPAWLDSWKPWIAGAVGLILIAYTPVLIDLLSHMVPVDAPKMKLW
ncbi:MAG: b(o/a)3-type cytochrome-c oxidase subunit 1 [Chloroflexi bacterium]|nr:b(o/a)3-type cytochrome-c oxidase subunit 1 [Chloroflexota bacterium]